jgi:hypothetical protein
MASSINPQPAIGNIVSYDDGCPGDTPCDCITLSNATFTHSSLASVNASFPLGTEADLAILYQPSWATAKIVGQNLVITGTGPHGDNILVYEVTNACSKACITVKIIVRTACTPTGNIVRNLSYRTLDNLVNEDIAIPVSSQIVSTDIGPIQANIYGTVINLNGVLQTPIAPSYSIKLKDDCGEFTISGNVVECVSPKISSLIGTGVLEKGIYATFGWVIEMAGPLIVRSVTGMPSGMAYAVSQNNPSVGFATITVAGTPVDNPCPSGSCQINFNTSTDCGLFPVSRSISQQPCRTVKVVRDVGSPVMKIGEPVNFCKVVTGYAPTISDYSDLPLGVTVDIAAGPGPGEHTVCLTGTPVFDPCTTVNGAKCACTKVYLTNSCGTKEIQFCTSIDMYVRHTSCIGTVKITNNPDKTTTIEVIGVEPGVNCNVWIGLAGVNTPGQVLTIDQTGYGTLTVNTPPDAGGSDPLNCINVSHPNCALVQIGAPVATYCAKRIEGG